MPDKRSLILQGTLDLIDERGLQSTPMSAIAKRSGVAMGTIYHHFESKEELVAALYVELIDRLGEYALQDYDDTAPVPARFSRIWRNALQFALQNRKEVLFLEQFTYSPYIDPAVREGESGWLLELGKIFIEGQEQEIIKPMNPEILIQMTMGILMYLVRGQVAGKLVLDTAVKEAAIEACWDTVKR